MKKQFRKIIATMVTIAMMFTMASPVFADDNVYLSDIRIVYAESLEEAQAQINEYNENLKAELETSDLGNLYETQKLSLFEYNLNEGTEAYMGFIGLGEEPHVYVAYATSTEVEDAITDIAVMDMNGGYTEGSLQAMLEESYAEYETIAEDYITAINYFKTAYESGSALADSAYRQLNLYFDPDSEMKLADALFNDITAEALSVMLLQGNVNILKNMQSLLAMGTSYNESGLSYLQTVEQTAAQYDADNAVFEGENWYETAIKVSGTFATIRDMIYKYNEVKPTLDYTDEEVTEAETQYLEYASITTMLENTTYINGESLADFICNYEDTDDSYLTVYPLVGAMNEGQRAIADLYHFYDVVRYSTTDLSAESMEAQVAELEEIYQHGLNIYFGVDREMFDGSYAVTTEAQRAAATSGRSIGSDIFGRTNSIIGYIVSGVATIGNVGLLAYNLSHAGAAAGGAATGGAAAGAGVSTPVLQQTTEELTQRTIEMLENTEIYLSSSVDDAALSFSEALQKMADTYNISLDNSLNLYARTGKYLDAFSNKGIVLQNTNDITAHGTIKGTYEKAHNFFESRISRTTDAADDVLSVSDDAVENAVEQSASSGISAAGAWAIFGGITLAITAANIGIWIYNYYNPELTEIPLGMVDMTESKEGDRYVLYNAVTMLNPDEDGTYHAACLNAFEGQAWNALYYTKSYEAGNALLADFNISYDNHKADNGYLPVHKFGDTVCFNLNKHAFGDELQIYLSVAQSDVQKGGAADVPDVVGSMVSASGYILSAGIGIAVGIALMAGIRRSKNETPAV